MKAENPRLFSIAFPPLILWDKNNPEGLPLKGFLQRHFDSSSSASRWKRHIFFQNWNKMKIIVECLDTFVTFWICSNWFFYKIQNRRSNILEKLIRYFSNKYKSFFSFNNKRDERRTQDLSRSSHQVFRRIVHHPTTGVSAETAKLKKKTYSLPQKLSHDWIINRRRLHFYGFFIFIFAIFCA